MKKLFLLILSFFTITAGFAQSFSVKWGDEMKLKKGSMDFDVINADETGVYVLEGKMKMKSYFVIGATMGSA